MRTDELQEIKQCPYSHVEVTVDDSNVLNAVPR